MEPRSLHYVAQAVAGDLINGSPDARFARVCTDSRLVEENDLFVALAGERFDAHQLLAQVAARGVAAIMAEKAKWPAHFRGCTAITVDNTRQALGRLGARYRRDFDLPIIAVGGSNGKTTTKELIASVLRQTKVTLWSEASFNNDIGVPLTLLRLDKLHQVAVLEAGTNHPGELAPLLQMIAPSHGVLTNIGREHLEFFGDLDGVAREEGAMAECLPASGILFVKGGDVWSDTVARRSAARVVRIGLGEGHDYGAVSVCADEAGVSFTVVCREARLRGEYRIKLLGRHQVLNALFALAVAAEMGLERAAIARGLATCVSAKMRLQLWDAAGVSVLDDAYNANADSMLAALETLRDFPCRGRRVAVLGDMAELGEASGPAHAEVGRRAAEMGLDQLFAIGPRAQGIAASARSNGLQNTVEILEVERAAEAVREFAQPGDAVLVKASRAMRLERITETLRNRGRTNAK